MWMKMIMMMGAGWMSSGHSRTEGGRQKDDGIASTKYFGLLGGYMYDQFDTWVSLLLSLV